jgi:hypothetical protein
MLLAGGVLDIFVLIEWLNDSHQNILPWTAVAQSLVVIGANLMFASLAVAMVDDDTSPA